MASLATEAMAPALESVVLWLRITTWASAPRSVESGHPPEGRALVSALVSELEAHGARIEAQLSGQIVASFTDRSPHDLVDLALALLEAPSGEHLAIALSSSLLSRADGLRFATALDDACALAARAKPRELLLDGAFRDRVPGAFLFTRQLSHGGLRAGSVDLCHPRRAETLRDLRALAPPPLVPATRALLEPLVEATRQAAPIVVLEGPIGAGTTELVEAARERAGAEVCLRLGSACGPLALFESLRVALAAAPGPSTSEAHRALVGGAPRTLDEAVDVVDAALGPARAWIVLNPLAGVDLATLEVVAALRRRRRERLVLVVRLAIDAPLPALLGEPSEETLRLTLPALRSTDAREVVAALLGASTSRDVVRRVAVMGGDSTLGCEEAARLLIAAGDLVREGEAFAWRAAPRGGVEAVRVEELTEARVELLSDEARRMLDVVSVAPADASDEQLLAVAARDGQPGAIARAALDALALEGWRAPRDVPTTHYLRRVVKSLMPPARLAELHRFTGEELASSPRHALTLGHFAVEGGADPAGDGRSVELAARLRELGFVMTAASCARGRAALGSEGEPGASARGASSTPAAPASIEPEVGPRAREDLLEVADAEALVGGLGAPLPAADERAVEAPADTLDPAELSAALRARDVERLERWVERAVLLGADLRAVARLRALLDVSRGDVSNAEARLGHALDRDDPKTLLAHAMVMLGSGRSTEAVRSSLAALALALRRGDARGRGAAYHALAACYRAVGRNADADELAARS